MPKKSALHQPVDGSTTAGVLVALAIGTVVGFVVGRTFRPLTAAYLQETASMMQNYGAKSTQTSKLMLDSAQMMQTQGKRWGDKSMMEKGKALGESGTMMNQFGETLTGRSSTMMDMMR